jgi:hypothetical protein
MTIGFNHEEPMVIDPWPTKWGIDGIEIPV